MTASLFYQGGTLVLDNVSEAETVPPVFQWIKDKWRCEGYHYAEVLPWLKEAGIKNNVPRWKTLDLTLYDTRPAHDYQLESLAAWEKAHHQGSIVLPTGAGKTFVAIHAIYQVSRSALVVAPTVDLLHQWYARLLNAFQMPIGVYYGAEKILEPLTVTTYHSAGDLIAAHGNAYKLLIFDEVHHLPAPSWGETALMSPAPFRLGLTATYPDAPEDIFDNRWRLEDLLGEVVYQLRIDDLSGDQLAEYRTQRIRVNLTAEEQARYEVDYQIYAEFFRSRNLKRTHGARWLLELMRLSSFDPEARRALLARQRLHHILALAEGKLAVLEQLLREYAPVESCLIFTDNNTAAYAIARRHLLPVITHETRAAERQGILEAFQAGVYRAIVTSKVLNEGVDVPEAKVAIVMGGSAQEREFIQRLGRVLRKVGNRQAMLFEIIARKTVEESRSQRRQPKKASP